MHLMQFVTQEVSKSTDYENLGWGCQEIFTFALFFYTFWDFLYLS